MSDIIILDESEQQKDKLNSKKSSDSKNLIYKLNEYLLSRQSLKIKDKVIFYRLLATMINSGVTLTKAVGILEKQEKEGTVLKNILKNFSIYLKEGKGLSECFLMYPSSFSNAEIGMIESGEKTGKLNISLKDVADQVEKLSSINGKLKSALMYPAMILVVMFLVVAVLMIMVVPKLLKIFNGGDNLPVSTRLLISISDFFVGYWWLMIIVIVGLFVFIGIWKQTPDGKFYYDKIILKIPIFGGEILRKIILSKFSRVFSGMIKSGVSIVEALRITSEAVGNEVYRQRILLLREDIKKGLKIYESLEDDPLFPIMMVSMIQVGEQTAKIDEIIIKIADFYDEEIDNTVGMINKLLEPIIIVIMAGVVGFIAVAIMQPIMNLADTVSNS